MSIAFWCIVVVCLLPYFWTGYSKMSKGYNNERPREFVETLTGDKKRAYWAALNAFEAITPFVASVIMAQISNPSMQSRIDYLACAFVIFRIAHGLAYIRNWATVRSLVWLAGFGCVFALFFTAAKWF